MRKCMSWDSYFTKNISQLDMVDITKKICIVNETHIDLFLEFFGCLPPQKQIVFQKKTARKFIPS